MKIYNKFVESKKEPLNKNDIWFDGSVVKIYKDGSWTTITLTKEATERLIEYANSLYVYVIVEELPTLGEDNKIYILKNDTEDSSVELLEYIWDDNGWKSVGNFNSINVTLDSPFEKGSAENSAVLRGGNNIATGVNSFAEGGYTKALSEVAHAEGLKTISGRISQLIDPTTGNIRELTNEEISTLVNEALRIGLITSQNEFNNAVAMKLIGVASHSEGSETKALGTSSHAEGNNTEASSNSSHAEGDSTHAWGEASHAEGYLTEANGNQSHSEGKQTKAQGNSSHAEGIETQANGRGSHAEGNKTITNNIAEHASGQYNKSTKSTNKAEATHFSIGIGTSDTKRKNAVEVKQNGDVYITGIGGFIGANSNDAQSVQEVINELINKLNEITTSETI